MQLIPYVSEIFVAAGVASMLAIAADLRSCRQEMRIMNWVWMLTGLWAGVFGLWAYFAFGRTKLCRTDERANSTPKPQGMPGMDMDGMDGMPGMDTRRADGMKGMPGMAMKGMAMQVRPRWQSVVLSTLHCGAGCTLADLMGEWFLYFVPVAIGGSLVAGSWTVDFFLALAIGIGFQYAAIRQMEPKVPGGQVVKRAAKADILSLTAWQAGMFGWMAVVIFGFHGGEIPARTSYYFWFMMQIAMGCGFLAALPVNAWLIRRSIKHGM